MTPTPGVPGHPGGRVTFVNETVTLTLGLPGFYEQFYEQLKGFEAFELRPENNASKETELAEELFDMGQDHRFPTHSLVSA